ncbi:MAG: hypothetical protein WCF12_03130, partial [Propionicimonas sp.]
RAKTRAGWRLRQPRPGLFTWRSPLGRHYWITPDGLTHNDPDHRPRNDPGDVPQSAPDPPESENDPPSQAPG